MELERKLMVAIIGAISAYIKMEQQSFPLTPEAGPEPEAGRVRFPGDTSAMKAPRA